MHLAPLIRTFFSTRRSRRLCRFFKFSAVFFGRARLSRLDTRGLLISHLLFHPPLFWKIAEAAERPNGRKFYSKRPYGVDIVVSSFDASSNGKENDGENSFRFPRLMTDSLDAVSRCFQGFKTIFQTEGSNPEHLRMPSMPANPYIPFLPWMQASLFDSGKLS